MTWFCIHKRANRGESAALKYHRFHKIFMIMRLAKGTQYHSHYSHYLFQEGQIEGSGGPTFEALCETEMRIKKAVLNYYIC